MMNMDEVMEFTNNILPKVDISQMSMIDQLMVGAAFAEYIEKIKPIYLKYASKDPEITNFIMKL